MKKNQIIYVKEDFLIDFSENLTKLFKDNFYDFENKKISIGSFRQIINPPYPNLLIKIYLENFFQKKISNENSSEEEIEYGYSLEKMVTFIVLMCFKKMNKFILEELISLIKEAILLFVPAQIYKEKGENKTNSIIGSILAQNSLFSDSINYKSRNSGFNKNDCVVVRIEKNFLPEEARER